MKSWSFQFYAKWKKKHDLSLLENLQVMQDVQGSNYIGGWSLFTEGF